MPKTISPERILYEDNDLLVVNKLAGELVVAAPDKEEGAMGKTEPLYDFIHKTHPGLRVVHRLDFATSGVLVFAKNAGVVKAIREGKFKDWKKTYRTIVAKPMKNRFGTINRKLAARTKDELVEATTHYRVIDIFPHATYVEVDIDTGRKHQIRQHLQFIGHPLLNDAQYGDPRLDRAFKRHHKYRRFFLHALRLTFPHPITGKEMTIMAPLPKAFEEVLKELKETKGKIINMGKPRKEGRSRKEGQKIRKGRAKKAEKESTWVKVDKEGKIAPNMKTAKGARRGRAAARIKPPRRARS
jgi:RluA family pseudouridine synthase